MKLLDSIKKALGLIEEPLPPHTWAVDRFLGVDSDEAVMRARLVMQLEMFKDEIRREYGIEPGPEKKRFWLTAYRPGYQEELIVNMDMSTFTLRRKFSAALAAFMREPEIFHPKRTLSGYEAKVWIEQNLKKLDNKNGGSMYENKEQMKKSIYKMENELCNMRKQLAEMPDTKYHRQSDAGNYMRAKQGADGKFTLLKLTWYAGYKSWGIRVQKDVTRRELQESLNTFCNPIAGREFYAKFCEVKGYLNSGYPREPHE